MRDKMSFGGPWTEAKLSLLEKYFDAYNQALKNMSFIRVYVDAFAGCGNISVRGKLVNGSAFRSLKCSNRFDKYLFIDKDKNNCSKLREMVDESFPEMRDVVDIKNCDSNVLIKCLNDYGFSKTSHRGVIFLDPFALELEWSSLEAIAAMEFLDVWYLFPIGAVLRCLPNIDRFGKDRDKITSLLGTNNWYSDLYSIEPTLPIFDEDAFIRERTSGVKKYVTNRLSSLFGMNGVAKEPLLLQGGKNQPLFLFYFAVSNRSPRARELALRIANHLLENPS